MGARDVLDDLRSAGLSVKLIDDKIVVAPKDKLMDPMRDSIRAHRDELALMLKQQAIPAVAKTTALPATPARIYRLTSQQADEAHAEPWTDEGIEMFNRRRDLFLRRGFSGDDADDLAETLTRRDAQRDDCRMCVECPHLGEQGRCLAAAAGKLSGADRRLEPVQTMRQRCEAFGLRKGLR